jgi:hypothetical protein
MPKVSHFVNGPVSTGTAPKVAALAPGKDDAAAAEPTRDTAEEKLTHAELLMAICDLYVECWRSPAGQAFVTIDRSDHREHYPTKAPAFHQWLKLQFHQRRRRVPSTPALTDVLGVLEGQALFGDRKHEAPIRVAGHAGKVYLDLCDDAWRVVEIDAAGWRIVTDPPVRFVRMPGMLPLPEPTCGGATAALKILRASVNLEDDDWPLFLGWLLGAFRPTGPYFVFLLTGPEGSAKSTTARCGRLLLDPHAAPLRRPPRTADDLWVGVHNSWLLAFDNMSHLPADLSDNLCCVATGGAFGKRTHYTNADETFLTGTRPVLLNGITIEGAGDDLLGRTLAAAAPAIPQDRRRAETAIEIRLARHRPALLGVFLTAVSQCLRRLPAVQKEAGPWPRMMDAAQWITAGETALLLKKGAFLRCYRRARRRTLAAVLDKYPILGLLAAYLEQATEKKLSDYKTSELLALLATDLGLDLQRKALRNSRDWPCPRVLSVILRRAAPALEECGWRIAYETVRGQTVWTIEGPPADGKPANPVGPQPRPRLLKPLKSPVPGTVADRLPPSLR